MRISWSTLLAITALAWSGCAGVDDGPGPVGLTGSGSGGSGSGGSSNAAVTATSAATSTSTTTGGNAGNCDPAAEAGSFYATVDTALGGTSIPMCNYRGEVVLAVNTAAL
jgi:hypothetical protein